MYAFVIFTGVLGAVIGSFVNVVSIRVPAGRSLNGRSYCPECDALLSVADLVPIVSWLFLRGRCRHCGAPVSAAYLGGESVCAISFVVLAMHFGRHPVVLPYLLLVAGLVALSIVDLRTYRLPDRMVGPLTVVVAGAFSVVAVVSNDGSRFSRGLEAAVAATAVLGLVHVVYPRGLGFGDVKLAFVLGMATGWVSWGAVGLAMFLAATFGALVGVVGAWVAGEPVHGRRLPFGPFLAAGALVAAVVGPAVIDWYMGLLR